MAEDYKRITVRVEDHFLPTLTTLAGDAGLAPWVGEQLPYLAEILKRDRATFSEPEASALVDACNGWLIEPHSVALLWAQVEDAVRQENLAEKWGIDGLALVKRLRELPYSLAWFVCRAATQGYWAAYRTDNDHSAALIACGLVKSQ